MPGPPPKHPSARARRNTGPQMTKLPAEGRKGRTPVWPLVDELREVEKLKAERAHIRRLSRLVDRAKTARERTAAERELTSTRVAVSNLQTGIRTRRRLERSMWVRMWRKPQAVMWERQGSEDQVALYVRAFVRGQLGSTDAAKEGRLMAADLGLTPLAMLRLHWEIDEPAAKPSRRKTPTSARQKATDDPRGFLRVV